MSDLAARRALDHARWMRESFLALGMHEDAPIVIEIDEYVFQCLMRSLDKASLFLAEISLPEGTVLFDGITFKRRELSPAITIHHRERGPRGGEGY